MSEAEWEYAGRAGHFKSATGVAWVEDCYHDSYVGAPADGSVWASGDCGSRVVRYSDSSPWRNGFDAKKQDSSFTFWVARTL